MDVMSEMLSVSRFSEEAEMYLAIEILGGDWQIMKSGAGELVLVLYRSCASMRSVALDPLPSMLARRRRPFSKVDYHERHLDLVRGRSAKEGRARRAARACLRSRDGGAYPAGMAREVH